MELKRELIPLLGEMRRCLKRGGEIWLCCPDMAKICRSYERDRGLSLWEDTLNRYPENKWGKEPIQHYINMIFNQDGEHRNLLDFELLKWALSEAGIDQCERVSEADLLKRFPGWPERFDDAQSVYVRATT